MTNFASKTVAPTENLTIKNHAGSNSNIQKEEAKIALTYPPPPNESSANAAPLASFSTNTGTSNCDLRALFRPNCCQPKVGATRITPCVSTNADTVTPTPRKRSELLS